jgi:N-acyl-D-amino-acid deacylase
MKHVHDFVIRRGRVVDGTGAPAFEADIAIDGGIISAVEPAGSVGEGRREIDAEGLLVTPGFVDMHTHYDGQVTWDPYLTPSSFHGCTTVVMGNCGVGFAPARPDKHDWLIGLMEGVEDIPGAALAEGLEWDWETFPEYMDALEKSPHAIDFATQVPHGAVRAYVMGERGAANEAATDDDIAAMKAIVKEAIEAGALGFSTSRTLMHKSIDGVPVPGTFAVRDELFGIGEALKESGQGVFELAGEHLGMPQEMKWMRDLAKDMKRPVVFNLSQVDEQPELYAQMLDLLDEAAAEDIPVYAQCAGRAIGIMMCWQGSANPFMPYPSYLQIAQLPWHERLEKMKDPGFLRALLSEEPVSVGAFEDWVVQAYDKMFPLFSGIEYEPDARSSVAAIAKARGVDPREVVYEALMQRDGAGMLYFPLYNYAGGDLSALHRMHSHPRTRMGLSDGGAHCGAICDGGMPTFMLTHWTRDRQRGPKLPLEMIVRRQTSETAAFYGLHDRGVIAPGYRADINVIDYAKLAFRQPELVHDLPAGGRRLLQRADGYVATICAGEMIYDNGTPTGAMPGKLVRGPQAEPFSPLKMTPRSVSSSPRQPGL